MFNAPTQFITPTQQRAARREAAAKASRTERIETQLAALQAKLNEARELHKSASFALVENPASKNVQAELEALEAEIARYEREGKRLSAALAQASHLDTEEARNAAAAARAAKYAGTCKASAARLSIATEIDKTVAHLGDLLKRWQQAGEPIERDAADLFRRGYVETFGDRAAERASDKVRMIRPLAAGDCGPIQAALARALYDIGLGRVGINGVDFINIRAPRTSLSVERAAEMAHHKLIGHLEAVGINPPPASKPAIAEGEG